MSTGAVAEDSPSPPPWLGRRQQRVLWILWIALVVVLVGYASTTVPGARHHRGYNALIDGWLQNGILVAAATLVAARAALTRSNRLAWSCIAMGISLYAAGNIIYFGWVQYDTVAHSPSIADFAWLPVYGFLYVGVTGLARPRVQGLHRTLWLDGLVGGLGVIAVATVWLQFLRTHTDGPRGAVLTALAYPAGDLILLVLVIGTCGLLGWRVDRQWLCLGVGMLMFAAADTIYALRVATDSYRAGTLLDPIWAVAVVVVAAAALSASGERQVARADGWSLLVVPSVFVLAALGLLVYGTWRHLPFLSVVLATGTVLAGLTRAGLTFRDVRFLAVSRAQARTDELTGLGNRRHFHEVLAARIAALTPDQHLAVLLLDLDRFKEVNDGLGHSVGDLLLVDVGARLSQVLRGGDLLVRLGGDEFALMLASSSPADALALAERLRTGLQAAFVVDGMTIYVDASIGIALCPDVATTVEGLLQRADIAMYTAKTNRLGAYVYQASADDDLKARLRRVEELGHAIDERQLVLHYQPKVDLHSGRIDGAEALVRWNHPEHGLLYPDAFLPDAERYGFMRGLTTCVLGIALDQVQQWRSDDGPANIAVNVSVSNLLDTQLPAQIRAMLDIRGLPGDALTIEVTEGILMVDPDRALAVLQQLRAHGVRVSIDDYGTGYSSLSRLRHMPVTELKLDQSFIRGIDVDDRAAAIVESTIRLAHSLRLALVAEGIETASEMQCLTALGCDVGQGYHLGRPVSAERFQVLYAAALN